MPSTTAQNQTIQYQPNLDGVPVNIQKELEFLRGNTYRLLNRVSTMEVAASSASSSSGGHVDAAIPTPTGDAAGLVYNLPSAPSPPESLQLFQGTVGSVSGQLLLGGTGIASQQGVANDYVLHNQTITFTVAPNAATQWLRAWYRTG